MVHVILMKRRVGFTSAPTVLTLSVLHAPVIVVTRSFRLSFTSMKFLPTMAEAAESQMSYAASQLTILSATIPVKMSTGASRSLYAKGE